MKLMLTKSMSNETVSILSEEGFSVSELTRGERLQNHAHR